MPPLDDPAARALYEDEALPRMSFGDHLDELRSRLIKSLLAIAVAVIAVLPLKEQVLDIILHPYHVQWRIGFREWVAQLTAQEAAGAFVGEQADKLGKAYLDFCREHGETILAGTFKYPATLPTSTGYPVPYELVAIGGVEEIMTFMFAALVFAVVVASPAVFWQIWAFIAAGLYPRERRLFYYYFPFMVGLMVAGVLFGYRIALPYSLGFLISMMKPGQVGAMFSVGQFLNLEFAMTAAMGFVFQLPLVMVALQRVGLVRHEAYRKHWRVTVLLIFLAAAIFTPPEPVSMLLMAAPMMLLYGLGLLLTAMGRKSETPSGGVAA